MQERVLFPFTTTSPSLGVSGSPNSQPWEVLVDVQASDPRSAPLPAVPAKESEPPSTFKPRYLGIGTGARSSMSDGSTTPLMPEQRMGSHRITQSLSAGAPPTRQSLQIGGSGPPSSQRRMTRASLPLGSPSSYQQHLQGGRRASIQYGDPASAQHTTRTAMRERPSNERPSNVNDPGPAPGPSSMPPTGPRTPPAQPAQAVLRKKSRDEPPQVLRGEGVARTHHGQNSSVPSIDQLATLISGWQEEYASASRSPGGTPSTSPPLSTRLTASSDSSTGAYPSFPALIRDPVQQEQKARDVTPPPGPNADAGPPVAGPDDVANRRYAKRKARESRSLAAPPEGSAMGSAPVPMAGRPDSDTIHEVRADRSDMLRSAMPRAQRGDPPYPFTP